MALADATTQRSMLSDKSGWGLQAVSTATPPTQVAIGALPWGTDPSVIITADLGTGAYFRIRPDGLIQQVDLGPLVPCNSATIPEGVFCREVALTQGLPTLDAGTPPVGSQQVTQWVRVSRKGEPIGMAVVQTKVLAR
jgi:hypothetical protein